MEIRIGNTKITKESRPYFIADIAANHDGDLDRALRLIELAKESGADAAKFQNFKAESIISQKGFAIVGNSNAHQSKWKKSVYEVYQDASLPEEWTMRLKEKCDEVGIEYMTTPYNMDVIDIVDPYVNCYKIGSGDINWHEFLETISKRKKPVLLATGACNLEEVKSAVKIVEEHNKQLIIMQCNTNYTASLDNMKFINLNVLTTYRNEFPNCILGLSDHTFGHETVLGAIALGATVIEKHFTDDNDRIGPDHKFSMNPKTWKEMVSASNNLFNALGNGIKKVEDNEKDSRIVQQRSLYFTRDLKEGTVIERKDIIALRPIAPKGILPYDISRVIGKKVNTNVTKDDAVYWESLSI